MQIHTATQPAKTDFSAAKIYCAIDLRSGNESELQSGTFEPAEGAASMTDSRPL
jgi:hypothetical protein